MTDIDPETAISAVELLKDIITPVGETVWRSYMYQAVCSGYATCVVMLPLVLITIWISYKLYFKVIEENENKPHEAGFTWGLYVVVNVGAGLLYTAVIYQAMMHILNPEYYVIQDILSNLGL